MGVNRGVTGRAGRVGVWRDRPAPLPPRRARRGLAPPPRGLLRTGWPPTPLGPRPVPRPPPGTQPQPPRTARVRRGPPRVPLGEDWRSSLGRSGGTETG